MIDMKEITRELSANLSSGDVAKDALQALQGVLAKHQLAIQPFYKPPFTELVYANEKGETVHSGHWFDSIGQKMLQP